MATRKKQETGPSSEAAPIDKPAGKRASKAAEMTDPEKGTTIRKAANRPAEGDIVETAKKAAKRVARAVSDTVASLTAKPAGTSKSKPKSSAAASADAAKPKTSKTPTAARQPSVTKESAKETSQGAPAKRSAPAAKTAAKTPVTAAARTKRTSTGALKAGTTSADVTDLISSGHSQDFTPESEIGDKSPTEVRRQFMEAESQSGPPPADLPRDIPDTYGDTRMVLLVRDPEWVYSYWEISDTTREELNLSQDNSRRFVIRFFKITDRNWPSEGAHYFFDVDVSPYAVNWYVKLPEVNQKWVAELGFFDEKENYISICRSNPILTPRNSISEKVDSQWMTVAESFEKITRMAAGSLATRLAGNGTVTSEVLLRQIQKQISGMVSGDSPALSSGFSGDIVRRRVDKGFWLQVHTELVLYGATEPDARVTVQGSEIKLNPDGTFSLRFALPEGKQILPVHATNADGDMEREIVPVVERTTKK